LRGVRPLSAEIIPGQLSNISADNCKTDLLMENDSQINNWLYEGRSYLNAGVVARKIASAREIKLKPSHAAGR
jgi:hypothetical protein